MQEELHDEDPAPEKTAEDTFDEPRDIEQIYFREISKMDLLSADEEKSLARLAKSGDFEARQKMILHNLRLVVRIARHYVNRGMILSDLIEEGNLGLMHAIEKFDPELGYRFSTYATWWIRQNVERAIMNQSRTIRLPVHVVKEINAVRREMQSAGGHDRKRVGDVARHLGMPAEHVWRTLQNGEWTVSLDAPLEIDSGLSVGECVPDEQNLPPDKALEAEEMKKIVSEWMDSLDSRQRTVLEKRYGFVADEMLTLDQLAVNLGVTRERVRQIQNESLKCLRKRFAEKGISFETLL